MGRTGVAIASGMLKGVFGHGVLSAFEAAGMRADVYGCASSSVFSGGLAAVGEAGSVGVDYWLETAAMVEDRAIGMSEVVLHTIAEYGPRVKSNLFSEGSSGLVVAVSQVATGEAADVTQGSGARNLGRRLIVEAINGETAWAEQNLVKVLFGKLDVPREGIRQLTEDNFEEVVYASSRMLHAWKRPAWIGREPFVDASYTCACPAEELAALGCELVIAIGSEPSGLYRDLFRRGEVVDGVYGTADFKVILPPVNLKDLGVDYAQASAEGLKAAYALGIKCGEEVLAQRLAPRHAG